MTGSVCRSCGSSNLTVVLRAASVPVEDSRLYAEAESARDVTTGDLVLARCEECGFVQNDAFDESLVTYDDAYEDSQAHSPYFLAFADRVIGELLDRYELRGGRALEIGCGRGDFLRMYCEASGGFGVGLDPSATREAGSVGPVEIRAERFVRGSGNDDADVVICRHTLEHVPDVGDFLATIREEFDDRPDAVLYLEVPDAGRIAAEGAFWDLYYEHCGYFDTDALSNLLRRTGWMPLESRLDYGGQYVVAHARPAIPDPTARRRSPVVDFGPIEVEIDRWRRWSAELQGAGRRSAVWAASSKAVGFLSCVPEFRPSVAVDINPAKWGQHLPSSGVPVVAPADLASLEIDTILVMNPLYLAEIRTELDGIGLTPTLVPLGG